MSRKTNTILGLVSLGALILAVPTGFLFPGFCDQISFLGTAYVNLLKLMIVPVLFFSISSSLSKGGKRVTAITGKTIGLFILMYVVSFLICSLLWIVIRPGNGQTVEEIVWDGEVSRITLSGFITSLFPDNILKAMSQNTLLPVILFAFVLGLAIRKCNLEKLAGVFSDLSKAVNQMLSYVMLLTPLGVFSLFCNTVAAYGGKVIGLAGLYIAMAYLGCLVITLLVMILPVWIFCKISPVSYVKRVYKVWIMTLSTCSSAATLPYTVRVCNEEFKVPEKITNLVVPLGCTIHMCGGAVSFSLLAFFNLQMQNIPLTFGLFMLMLGISLVLNMGAPGIPGGGIVIGATYLSILGIPLSFIGFYAGIYRVLDMAYTTMNVCGDISANALIAKSFEGKDEKD